jgi:hypothetical protein
MAVSGWKPVGLPLIDVDDRSDSTKTPPRISRDGRLGWIISMAD